MNPVPQTTTAITAPRDGARLPARVERADPAALAHRVSLGLGNVWAPRAAWAVRRTGRAGLAGIALLVGSALFLLTTHLKVAAEVDALRADLAAAQRQGGTAAMHKPADPRAALRVLPPPGEIPATLRQLFARAKQARLAMETGKYDASAVASSGIVRYRIELPVTGPYPQIRSFIDSTLATLPEVGLSELVLDRKAIIDGNVAAQIRVTIYAHPGAASADSRPKSPAPDRVVGPTHAGALFAQHTWAVIPPAPPPPPPPPPPAPTAPPFPYAFIGSYAPEGHTPVYFLSQGDRVIDAHVGDRLDGVYQFESAGGGQLVFVYLPLDVRQTLAAGVSP